MIDWDLTPENQVLYEKVVAQNRRLQQSLGIQPMTIDERATAYQKRNAEIARKEEELKRLREQIGRRRPVPKWKV